MERQPNEVAMGKLESGAKQHFTRIILSQTSNFGAFWSLLEFIFSTESIASGGQSRNEAKNQKDRPLNSLRRMATVLF